MEESLRREYRLSSPAHRHDQQGGPVRRFRSMPAGLLPAVRLLGTIWASSAQSFGRATLWRTMPDLAGFSEQVLRDAGRKVQAAPQSAVSRAPRPSHDARYAISAMDAIWHERVRARAAKSLNHWAVAPDLPRATPARRRDEPKHLAPLTVFGRIAAAIGEWRRRARSYQELCRLNNHLLKDIGLTREDLGYGVIKPRWHRD